MIDDKIINKYVSLVLKLAPYDYIGTLYNYENKFMLYDIIFWQNLLLEKENRINSDSNDLLKIDIYQMLNNYCCPDTISYLANKRNFNNANIINLVNEFNKKYEIIMENYIDFINNIADFTTLSKEKISPKGIGLLGILSYGNIMYGLNRDVAKMKENKKRQEKDLEVEMENKIAIKRQELCENILNNYNVFKNELLSILLNND